MKIFAYNLCLDFKVKSSNDNYSFPLISFAELMGRLFKGMDFDSQVFYIQAESGTEFKKEVFNLQANEIWRNMNVRLVFIFESREQLEKFLDPFMDFFQQVDAAGGLVESEKSEYLIILSRNRWTLPKGGVEWREDPTDAAIREVMEETSLEKVEIMYDIPCTYHTFFRRKKWVMKTTYWYKMFASSEQEIKPQEKEGIKAVRWISKQDWINENPETYPLNREIFEQEFARTLNESAQA